MLGIIGGLPLGQLPDIPMLNDKYNLIEFLARYLTPGFTEDDVLLEVIVVFGSLAANPECASRISQSRVLSALYSIITEKQEDDEIVLQILYAFFHLLQANEPRFALLQQTQLVVYLLDLLLDKNEAIRKMSSLCLMWSSRRTIHGRRRSGSASSRCITRSGWRWWMRTRPRSIRMRSH